MSGHNEELLSAYFDGELSDDEKLLVEQLLDEDVAAREALDDVAEVSGWVRSLPRSAAPAELRDAVLARVRATATPISAVAPVPRPTWRRHARWAAASAAGLLLAVVVYQTWPVPDAPQIAASRGLGTDGRWGDDRLSGESESRQLGEVAVLSRTASIVNDPMALAYTNSDQMLEGLEKALESGAAPVPGEMVQNLTQVGDQVIVIQSQVVNTQDLLGRVQVLLTQNGIKLVNDSPEPESLKFDSNQNGAFEVIYVDAPTTNFNTAVDQITDLDLVTSVTTNSVSLTEPAAGSDESSRANEDPRYFRESRRDDRASDFSLEVAPSRAANGEGAAPLDALTTAAAPVSPPASVPPPKAELSDGLPRQLQLEQLSEMSTEAEGIENPVPAYQVPVQVSPELWGQLQRHEQVLGGTPLSSDESKANVPQSKLQKQQFYNWNYSLPPGQGPPSPPDRVRAVILLVPQKAE